MSQYEIYKFLKENKGKKYSYIELCLNLNMTPETVWKNLRSLKKHDDIFIDKSSKPYYYFYSDKLRKMMEIGTDGTTRSI